MRCTSDFADQTTELTLGDDYPALERGTGHQEAMHLIESVLSDSGYFGTAVQ
jgi:hypothetical protein